MSPRFSSNSEALASELLENLEGMFPLCYMNGDVVSLFKSSTTHGGVTRRERVKAWRCIMINTINIHAVE